MKRLTKMKLKDVLVIPIQEELHDTAAEEIGEEIIKDARESGAQGVILDISALEIVDSFLGRLLGEVAHALEAMGKKVVVMGIRPDVAITLVELGLDLGGIPTALNLEAAMNVITE